MTSEYSRTGASKLFEAIWRANLPDIGLPTSKTVHNIDFEEFTPYLLMGKFTRPTGSDGAGARMDIDHAGKGIAERLNVDITGFEYFCRLLPEEKTLIVGVFENLFDHGCGRWRAMFYRFDKGSKIAVDTTFFPYTCSETGAERVCALIVPAELPHTGGDKGHAYAALAGPSALWIKLNAGIPDSEMLSFESG